MSTDKILVKVSQNAQVKLSEDQTIVKKIVLGPPVKRVTAAKFDASTLNGDSAAYYLDYNNFTNTPTILDSDMIKRFTLDSSEVLALVDSAYIDQIGLQNIEDSGSGIKLIGPVKITDHVLPDANQQYDLGSPTNKFRALYIAGRTVYLGNLAMSDSGGSLTLASLDSSGEVIPGTSQAVLTSAIDSDQVNRIIDDRLDSSLYDGRLLEEVSQDFTLITQQTIDTFSASALRTAKYLVQIEHDADNKYHSSELLLTHNGSQVYITEYAMVTTDSSLGEFDASITGGNVVLTLTPSYTNTSFKSKRIDVNA